MSTETAPETSASPETATPTQKPKLRWDISIWALINSALATIPVLVFSEPSLMVYSVLPALLLTVVMILAPPGHRGRIGIAVGLLVTAVAALTAATADSRPAVVVTTVIVIYLSSLPRNPGSMVLGALASIAYLVFAWTGSPVMEAAGVGALEIAAISAMASVITIVAFAVAVYLLRRFRPAQLDDIEEIREAEGEAEPPASAGPGERAWEFLGPANPMFRYAVVRSLAVGVVFALVFSERGQNSAFWVLLAMLLVSRPTGHAALQKALERTVATVLGVVVFLAALALLSESVVLALSVAILLVGLAYIQRSSIVLTACATVFVIAVAGAAQSDYLDWATARLIDTVVGSAIGVVVSILGEARTTGAG